MDVEKTAGCRGDGRRGIALITVLGFVSVLVLMAVAFLVTMRTERLVSEYAVEEVRARQLAHTAIGRAMADLGSFLQSTSDSHLQSPIFKSSGSGGALGAGADLVSGEVTNWLPRRFLLGAADPDYNASFDARAAEQAAQWVLVKDPEDPQRRILGRYAYLVLDCTGMLDANLVSGSPIRQAGTSVAAEVDYGFLPEIGSTDRRNRFSQNRQIFHRFATLPEIIFLNDGYDTNSLGEQYAVEGRLLNNLMPYSLCYNATGYWNGTVFTRIASNLVSSDVRQWWDPGAPDSYDQFSAFQAAGYNVTTSTVLTMAFRDYVDSDYLPSGASGGAPHQPDVNWVCCEAIPMINEVGDHYRLRQPGGDSAEIQFIHRVIVELWYPFPGTTNSTTYTISVTADNSSFNFLSRYWDTSGAPHNFNFTLDTGKKTATPVVVAGVGNRMFCVTAEFVHVYSPPEEVSSVKVRSQLKNLTVEVSDGANVVDRCLPSGYLSTPECTISGGGDSGELAGGNSWQVLDPRMNYESSLWSKQSPTFGSLNVGVNNFCVSANGDFEGTNMYVRNSTNLETVAELGFLPTGAPWTTIDLFSDEGRKLLRMFRVGGFPNVREYTNGWINPNTHCTNVIYAAFRNVPVDAYPGESPPTGGLLSDDSLLRSLAKEIVAAAESGSFNSRADWVTVPSLAPGGLFSSSYVNNQKDAIIRNSYRLFNVNQNLYTVVVVAQSIKDEGAIGTWNDADDVVLGEKRAVAVVWRDPFVNSNGRHETFVRLFRYLTE